MNKIALIGNLTADPELRTTTTGKQVCSFTVAVNRRQKNGNENQADFFRVSVWNQLAEVCQKYLGKGRKVSVVGRVSVEEYTDKSGKLRSNLCLMAEDVEFISPKSDPAEITNKAQETAYQDVTKAVEDQLPF